MAICTFCQNTLPMVLFVAGVIGQIHRVWWFSLLPVGDARASCSLLLTDVINQKHLLSNMDFLDLEKKKSHTMWPELSTQTSVCHRPLRFLSLSQLSLGSPKGSKLLGGHRRAYVLQVQRCQIYSRRNHPEWCWAGSWDEPYKKRREILACFALAKESLKENLITLHFGRWASMSEGGKLVKVAMLTPE